jgi:hypothetical protein
MSNNSTEKNNFIYENRDMPRKQLAELANQKFGCDLMDYDLPTIINKERKKRSKAEKTNSDNSDCKASIPTR